VRCEQIEIFSRFQPLAKFDRKEIQRWKSAVVFRKPQSIKGRETSSKSTNLTPLGGAKLEVSGQNRSEQQNSEKNFPKIGGWG